MDPMNNFGLGGLANEVHLGSMRSTVYPTATPYSSGTPDGWQGSGGYGVGSYRPSLIARLGGRIFGSSWDRISRTTHWVMRLGCVAAGFYFGGHYTPLVLANLAPEATITTTKILVGAAAGGTFGYIALPLLRLCLPLVLVGGVIGLAGWFFLN